MVYLEIINIDPVFRFVKNWMLHRRFLFPEEISIKSPTVFLTATREDLMAVFYRRERMDPQHNASNEKINPLAFYSPNFKEDFDGAVEKAIVLIPGFNQGSLEDIAVLTHEFVHFLQDMRGRWVSICGTIIEAEALIIEEMFRRDFHLRSISDELAQQGYRLGP